MGPKCWDEETMGKLIDAGMTVARFNFSHGDHDAHQAVLDRFRKVCAEKESHCAVLLDTKGPEVRTAMLKDHEPIELEAGQEIIVYAAGPDEYTTFEGYKTPEETKIGCSYAKLCQSVKPGNRLLFADGSVVIKVLEIIDDRHLRGEVLNDKKLGERKNGNLPGVKVELDVLQPKDADDIKNFARTRWTTLPCPSCRPPRTFSWCAASSTRTVARTSRSSRRLRTRRACNFDDILKYTDGVMQGRLPRHGDPPEGCAYAPEDDDQWRNIAGKFTNRATCRCWSQCARTLSPLARR